MLAALLEVGEILVGQVLDVLAHVVLGHLDEKSANPVADTSRAAVQHEPNSLVLVETDLNKVIAGSQRAQMIDVVAAVEPRIFFGNQLVALLDLSPHADLAL